ncbi:hypothetical protein Nepgr_013705 [Nepenthes gracilis]|uniref:Uncharacterized protein n=1 Tax=Nepenthes gracilis TaxID=150966 RepID=A0AAD3XPF1_NEPGR|nr:hypothetical protein Nepgr_013705 [Nepenthes gracilis]
MSNVTLGGTAGVHTAERLVRLYSETVNVEDVEKLLQSLLAANHSSEVLSQELISSYFRREAYDRLEILLEHIESSCELTK